MKEKELNPFVYYNGSKTNGNEIINALEDFAFTSLFNRKPQDYIPFNFDGFTIYEGEWPQWGKLTILED